MYFDENAVFALPYRWRSLSDAWMRYAEVVILQSVKNIIFMSVVFDSMVLCMGPNFW